MPKLSSSFWHPVKLRYLFVAAVLALALAPASASAWVREAAPAMPHVFQPQSALSVLPDGSVRYLGAIGSSNPYANQLVVRPAVGPVAFASPFPTAFGQYTTANFLSLSPQDASGDQLVLRGVDSFGAAFLAPGADPAGVTVEPTNHVTEIDLAPSGEAAAIVNEDSKASMRFRPAGPAGRFDAPRLLDRAGNQRSYGIGITIDPDGGVFILYRTEQDAAVLQTYAPPGANFGPPQPIDVPSLGASGYGDSTNGHGVFAWSEDTGGPDSNYDVVWAMTRSPGGLLTDKTQVATARSGGLVSVTGAAAVDDATSYVNFIDAGPIACLNNNYRFGGSVLAVKGGGASEWTKLNTPTTGNERRTIEAISTAGNTVGLLSLRTIYPNNICTEADPSSALEVQLGQGSSPGAPQTVASEGFTGGANSTIVRTRGFAVNAGGAAALLVSEPLSAANNSSPYLYYQAGTATAVSAPAPTKPLPAPGKIKISGKKLVARGGEVPFEASCTRLPGEGSKLFCSIGAILLEQEKRKGKGKSSAVASAGKKKAAKPKVLATAKPVKVPVGKTKTITLKLNKLGKAKLKEARKAGLKVTLKVTIDRRGYATNTIERKLKLVAGKAKKPKGKKGR